MSSDQPLGHVDEGEPLYIVHDKDEQPISYHRTTHGADAILQNDPNATGITETTVYH